MNSVAAFLTWNSYSSDLVPIFPAVYGGNTLDRGGKAEREKGREGGG